MPARRTSPRRTATRPNALHDLAPAPFDDDLDEPRGALAGATPWLALLAVVLATASLGYALLGRSGGDQTDCRKAAWQAIPKATSLPDGWALTSTDLNANGMTVSILGPAPADETTNQPVVYASVTCYGDAAAAALEANQRAAAAAGATVESRSANDDAYDVTNEGTGSRTTLFRVGSLVGQVADGGSATDAELATITTALATAMGDRSAAGVRAPVTDDPNASLDPLGSGDLGAVEPSQAPFAPELEALLPRSINATAGGTASPGPIALSVISASASDVFGDDPSSRAFAARIRTLGGTFDKLQVARSFDETGAIDLIIDAFRLPNADVAKLRTAILESWLSSTIEGVKTTPVTLGGKKLTKVDYGDGRTIEYVYAVADAVIVIDTSDVELATQVAAQLK